MFSAPSAAFAGRPSVICENGSVALQARVERTGSSCRHRRRRAARARRSAAPATRAMRPQRGRVFLRPAVFGAAGAGAAARDRRRSARRGGGSCRATHRRRRAGRDRGARRRRRGELRAPGGTGAAAPRRDPTSRLEAGRGGHEIQRYVDRRPLRHVTADEARHEAGRLQPGAEVVDGAAQAFLGPTRAARSRAASGPGSGRGGASPGRRRCGRRSDTVEPLPDSRTIISASSRMVISCSVPQLIGPVSSESSSSRMPRTRSST